MAPPTRTRPHTHPVDEVLPASRLAVYGVQHVLCFYAGAVVVPILLAGALGLTEHHLVHLINADLFTCAIASIIQSVGFWKVGVRLPLLQGVTFTAVSPMIAIGLAAVYREKFGIPLIMCVRNLERRQQVVHAGWRRMENARSHEHMTALNEISEIANHRFDDLVSEANPIASARIQRFEQLH